VAGRGWKKGDRERKERERGKEKEKTKGREKMKEDRRPSLSINCAVNC